jgi:hypothetical protein
LDKYRNWLCILCRRGVSLVTISLYICNLQLMVQTLLLDLISDYLWSVVREIMYLCICSLLA